MKNKYLYAFNNKVK